MDVSQGRDVRRDRCRVRGDFVSRAADAADCGFARARGLGVCRAYYFAFYVIERYADPSFKFSGLWSFVRYLTTRHRR